MTIRTVRVVGIDHLVIRVSDYERSKAFYGRLFGFLGFEVSEEYDDAIGWTNGRTRFWIGPADAGGQEARIPHRRRRLPPLRVPAAQPQRRRRAAWISAAT